GSSSEASGCAADGARMATAACATAGAKCRPRNGSESATRSSRSLVWKNRGVSREFTLTPAHGVRHRVPTEAGNRPGREAARREGDPDVDGRQPLGAVAGRRHADHAERIVQGAARG